VEDMVRLIMADGMKLAIAGFTLGLAGVALEGSLLRNARHGVQPRLIRSLVLGRIDRSGAGSWPTEKEPTFWDRQVNLTNKLSSGLRS